MTVYAQHFGTRQNPQTEQVPGKDQVENSAGGFVFKIDKWQRLDRFLVLGSEGGTYYVNEKKLTVDNAKSVLECIQENGKRTVDRIVEISEAGRAPKNDPAIFALAMASSLGNQETKSYALSMLPRVARIGTHLFQFAESVQSMRGWGRGLRRAIGDWYTKKSPDDIAFQCAKYQQRNGWSHRDLLRLAKPKAGNSSLLRWVAGKDSSEVAVKRLKVVSGKKELIREDKYAAVGDTMPQIVQAFEAAKRATTKEEIVRLIRDNNLPRECVPTQWLNSPEVWEALLEKMPLNALVRNLGKMTNVGVLAPMSAGVGKAMQELANAERIKKSRLHPIAILMALRTYTKGHGDKGQLTWNPVPQITDALNSAFYMAFENIEPTNKRWLLGIDVSGSMSCSAIANSSLTACEGAAAMAMATAYTEPQYYFFGFCHQFTPLPISKGMRLDDVMKVTSNHNFGRTDCALPMLYAMQNNIPVDAFAVYTDNETWAGSIHPFQALRQYRDKTGINAKLIVCGMTATQFSIADPDDPGSLDVVGFDASTPAVIADFVR